MSEVSGVGNGLHPDIAAAVADLVRGAECLFSNAIENRSLSPVDIDLASSGNRGERQAETEAQAEARSHVEVDAMIATGAFDGTGSGSSLLKALHKEFCGRLPRRLLVAGDRLSSAINVPGEWRTRDVGVGTHVPVSAGMVEAFMAHFDRGYAKIRPEWFLIATAASHHRLAWIHPFTDCNGRIARKYTRALLRTGGANPSLWSLSRGLSMERGRYFEALERADWPPQGAMDGRGTLSEKGLAMFIDYFLDTCETQIAFMARFLDRAGLERRLEGLWHDDIEAGRIDPRLRNPLLRMYREGCVTIDSLADMSNMTVDEMGLMLRPLLDSRRVAPGEVGGGTIKLAFPLAGSEAVFPDLLGGKHAPAPEPPDLPSKVHRLPPLQHLKAM